MKYHVGILNPTLVSENKEGKKNKYIKCMHINQFSLISIPLLHILIINLAKYLNEYTLPVTAFIEPIALNSIHLIIKFIRSFMNIWSRLSSQLPNK